MMHYLVRLLIPLYCFFFSSIVSADVPTWKIIPEKSHITFTATQNNAPVTGEFKTFNGDIHFDPKQLTASHVRIVVDLNSVTTSYKEIEKTLKTADWFNVTLFPQAIFTANTFIKTGDNTYKSDGKLTLRDKTLPVTLLFTLEEYSQTLAKAHGKTTLKRTLFGVGQGEWGKTDSVKDDVQVDFILNASR